MKRIVVVGGGITGLSAAYRLQTQSSNQPPPPEIHLIEASDQLGGILRTTSRDGFLLESGPDCFLSEKLSAMNLCLELGLMDQVISTRTENRRSFIVKNGRLHPTPQGFYLIGPSQLKPFLQSPLLSWWGKWRVLADALLPGRPRADESLASFVRRRFGRENLDWLAQPLLAGIYAADPETLSLRATFPQFIEMEEKHGSVLVGLKKRSQIPSPLGGEAATQRASLADGWRGEGGGSIRLASGARYSLFSTLRGGMQTLAEQLEKNISGVQVRRNTAVKDLEKRKAGWVLTLSSGETLEADGVCLALPAYQCAELVRDMHPVLAEALDSIRYSGSATINFAWRESDITHPLDGFGFVTPFAEKRTTLACTFVHKKFAGRAPNGHALLRAFVGGALQEDLLQLADAELEKRVLKDLNDLLGIKTPPIFSVIQRWPRAMPQYTLGHIQRVLQIEETLTGMKTLTMAGNWLRGVGIPDCIESGQRAAATLLA